MNRYVKAWNPSDYYKNSDVAGDYDSSRFRSWYGRLFNAVEKREIAKAFAGLPANASVVDVPCGTGRLAEVLLESGYKVRGVDISPDMLEVAKKRLARFGEKFSTQVCDARELSRAERFDGALCARVLMHFPLNEQIEFLKAVAAVTSGPVVFTQGLNSPYQRLRRRFKRILRNQNPASFPLTAKELRVLVAQSGLRIVKLVRLAPMLSESMVIIAERVA